MKCQPTPQPRKKSRCASKWLSLLAVSTILAVPCFGAGETLTPVSESDARTVAVHWLSEQLGEGASLPDVTGTSPLFDLERSKHLGWLVDLSPAGYVLLPVYRELPPIYGYSLESDLDALGRNHASAWFRTALDASVKRMEALRNNSEAQARFDANRALWQHWLSLGQRAQMQGVPVIEFVYRESLLNDRVYSGMTAAGEDTPPEYPGDYQKPLSWHSSNPYNRKAPIVRTTPEEIWLDVDETASYTESEGSIDLKVYDADGTWSTSSDPAEPGHQTGLYFFDDDGNGAYSYTNANDDGYITAGGEWIWRDENGDGHYTHGIDQPVKPALTEANQDQWIARSNTIGEQGDLYYTSTVEDGRYTFTEAHARPGSYVAAMAMLTRYWEWPDVGLGEHSYDWAYREGGADEKLHVQLSADFEHAYNWPRMPLNSLASHSAAEQDNVAQLLYDIGVAFEIDFQLDTPLISPSQAVVERFAHHFRYNRHAIQFLERADTEGDDAWFAEIAEEIDAKRPVVIQAFGGETFISPIIDGYLKSTGYTDDPDTDTANANMYLVHCNINGAAHWWGLDNISGLPYGEPDDAQTGLLEQKATVGIVPQRVPQAVVCEAFVDPDAAGTPEFHDALTAMQNRKGGRFLTLVYHPDPADPHYLGDHDLSQDILDERMADYGLEAPAYPVALLNGADDDLVQGNDDALADQLDLYAAYQRQTNRDSRYRIVGDSVIGTTPDENKPVVKADIYVTRLDEDIPESETLTLTTVLAEKVNDGAHWVVREFLDSREFEFGYGLTRIANVTQLPELPEADWDLDEARIVVLLEREDGTVVQGGRMQRFAPGPNYQIVDGLGLYRATLVNHAPKAPTDVILTQTSEGGDTHLHAEAVGAHDPDGDALRYEYRWYKNGIRQADLDEVTADTPHKVTDPNPDSESLWYCEVRVLDEYYEQGNTLDGPGDPGSDTDPVEKESNHVSATVLSNPVLIVNGEAPQDNQPPEPPDFAEITPDNASEQDTLTCLTDGAADPDGDAVNLVYKWYKDGDEQPDHTTPRLPYGTVSAGEEWKCEVIAQDQWGETSAAAESAIVTIAEARTNPPTRPLYVSIGPDEPSYESTLSCGRPIGVVSDSGDPVEIHYRWWRMDERSWRPTTHSGVIAEDEEWVCEVEMTRQDIGTLWRCELFARNTETGANGPAYTTPSLLVRNKVPDTPTANVAPQFAKIGEDLRCFTSGGFDAEDSENVAYHYEWFVNGQSSRISGFGLDTVDSSFTSAGETWTCKIYAQDSMGGRSSTVTAEGEVFIGSSPTPPEKAVVSPRRPESDQIVTCTGSGASDPDGQPITYQYTWYVAKRIRNTGEIPPPSPEMLPENRDQWYWEEAYSGSNLPADATTYGERYACLVTATDGQLTSSPISSPKIIIGNQPPSKPEISVSPDYPRPGEAITCEVTSESTDTEGDPFSYVFEWFRSDSEEVQYLGATLPAGRTAIGETWYCQVTVTDSPPGGLPEASSTVQSDEIPFVSVPPTEPTDVAIEPTSPKSGDDLVCTAEGSTDPNGDAITYTFLWQKNTGEGWQDTEFTDDVLESANTADGEQWRCAVTAVDATDMSSDSVVSSSVTIGNRAPNSPATPVVTPDPAGLVEDLACTADGSSDPNGDQVNYQFQWYRVRPSEDPEAQPVDGATQRILDKNRLAFGDTWFCQVRASDGELSSDWVSSNSVDIANLPPTSPETVVISPEQPTSIQDLTCNASGSTDPESDPVHFSYTWKRNGEVTAESAQVVEAGSTGVGESWTCEVRAVDSNGNSSEPLESEAVTVVAPNPSDPEVALLPEDPTRYDNLECQATGSEDPAGLDITYTYVWSYRERGADASDWQTPDPLITGSVVNRSNLENGQSWRCAVYAENETGFRSATVTGNEVVIRNRPPTAPTTVSLELFPEDDKAMCSMTGARDFEAFTYEVEWQKYQEDTGSWNVIDTSTGIVPGDNAELEPIAFDDSFYRCSVIARDAEGAPSSATFSNVVKASANLPGQPDLEIESNGRELTATATVADPAGRTVVFLWFRDGFRTAYSSADEDGADGFASTITVPPSETEQVWSCRAYAVDQATKARSRSATAKLDAATYDNDPPSVPVPELIPSEPRVGNNLEVLMRSEAVDPDNDDVVYHYNWYLDGVLEKEHTGPVLEASETSTGDIWSCVVIARDQYGAETKVQIDEVEISAPNGADQYEDDDSWELARPLGIGTGQSHNLHKQNDMDWMSFELEGEADISLRWTVIQGDPSMTVTVYDVTPEGAPDTEVGSVTSSPLELATLPAGEYFVKVEGEWSTDHDSASSYPVYSLTLETNETIVDNRAPTAPTSVEVRPAAPIPGDPLRCVARGARDPDGDSLTHTYHWYQNGSFRPRLSGENKALLPAAATMLDDSWTCRVRVADSQGKRSEFAESSTVPLGNAADWSVAIDVEPALNSTLAKNPDAVAALTSPLTFGQNADATDGWDDDIDDAAPPANSTIDAPYVAFDGSPRMQTDIRTIEAKRKIWTIKADLTSDQDESITLSWDQADLPERGVLQMRDKTTGALINMRDVSEMTIDDANDTGTGEVHEITVAYDASYTSRELLNADQSAGWHLLSLILEGPFSDPGDIFGQITLGSTWQYDSETGQYQGVEQLQVGRAYWLYFPKAVLLEHLGYPALSTVLELQEGWNLVGVTVTSSLPAHPDIDPAQIWSWNAETGEYENPDILQAGGSYWIYADSAITITLE